MLTLSLLAVSNSLPSFFLGSNQVTVTGQNLGSSATLLSTYVADYQVTVQPSCVIADDADVSTLQTGSAGSWLYVYESTAAGAG